MSTAKFKVGTHNTLARVSSASATHTLACAAAITSGRASESRNAVARLIGNRRSVGANGAGLRLIWTGLAGTVAGSVPAAAGCRGLIGATVSSTRDEALRRGAVRRGGGGRSRPFCCMNRSIAGDTDDSGTTGAEEPSNFSAGTSTAAVDWAEQGRVAPPCQTTARSRIPGPMVCFIAPTPLP